MPHTNGQRSAGNTNNYSRSRRRGDDLLASDCNVETALNGEVNIAGLDNDGPSSRFHLVERDIAVPWLV